ncbi:9715_t:CDS:2 [Entrophospora sp. SA101]|nr:5512_t:CDS:2 [Entrophospora candida]CAH1768020.1 5176_t:CDS:2 [Entrophospora sp. SA101]CAJ0645656.1 9715_t:CDS:2 [Entrophospora sp. SA101]CAJ0839450.1 19697_t:CDS:2 [Entrophospora sp. SA101]CAJ0843153.1 1684_t:CDS:2 [Entrophospora sp. SA101]
MTHYNQGQSYAAPSNVYGQQVYGGQQQQYHPPPQSQSSVPPSGADPQLDWNDKMEIEFFRAVIKYRPIGKHRHFRMLNVAKEFNANSPIKCSIPELWERLRLYYNLQKLEDLEHEVEFHNESLFSEFNLIINDHESLVPSENRKSESSRGESPSKKKQIRK